MARAYTDFAWAARGSGWIRDVPEDSWKVFRQKLQKAWDVLNEAEKLKEKDPELYRIFLIAGMGLDKSDKEMNSLLEKGIAIDKGYYPLYLQRANNLLPRWGGRKGELEAFAKRSAELNKGQGGEALYAKIVAEVVPMFYSVGADKFLKLKFSYQRTKQGHIEILEKYPEASYYLNTYCLLASVYKDKETARKLFDKIGENWNRKVWKKQVHFDKYRNWVYE